MWLENWYCNDNRIVMPYSCDLCLICFNDIFKWLHRLTVKEDTKKKKDKKTDSKTKRLDKVVSFVEQLSQWLISTKTHNFSPYSWQTKLECSISSSNTHPYQCWRQSGRQRHCTVCTLQQIRSRKLYKHKVLFVEFLDSKVLETCWFFL